MKSELYEKAIQFFERASQIQPNEVKWRLMVTSCYRRMGSYQKALQLYEEIHQDYPENLECLRYLVAICKDLGQRYDGYQQKLVKLEREVAAKQQAQQQQQVTIPTGMTRSAGSQQYSARSDDNDYQQQTQYQRASSPPSNDSYNAHNSARNEEKGEEPANEYAAPKPLLIHERSPTSAMQKQQQATRNNKSEGRFRQLIQHCVTD